MGLFGFGKDKKKETAAPAAPAAPASPAPEYTAEQYVTAGHSMRAAKRWSEAVECYKAAANMSNAEGLYWLGNCVMSGIGAEENALLACQLYSLAARMKHPQATDTLFQYLNATIKGHHDRGDYASLTPYLKAGAEAGHIQSVYLYGYFLTVGAANLPQDKKEGYKWIKLAADSGYDLAKESLKEYF